MEVYVLNKERQPLMPTKPAIARLLLKEGKAKCIRRIPFTIKLLVDTTDYKQEVVAGMDTGSKTIGCAAITNSKVVYQSEVQIRQDVSKKMEQRRMYRRNRRGRFKKHVTKGDYQQTKGSRSEKKIPTGKLFGLRKFDCIQTPKGIGFVKGKRSTGFFTMSDLGGNVIGSSVNVKKDCTRLKARTTTLIERRMAHFSMGQATVVSCA